MPASLIPLNVVQLDPSNLGSADCDYIGLADDGMEYAIKTTFKNPTAPAAEWFCHGLAALCHVAIPQYEKLTMPDKSLAFGSQWDGAAVNDPKTKQDVINGTAPTGHLPKQLSVILAFDLFVYNTDRHIGNYLFVRTKSGYAVRAFDFSRAWTSNGWPPPNLILSPTSNTINTYNGLKTKHPFELPVAKELFDKLRKVPNSSIKSILDEIPAPWMVDLLKSQLEIWWDSADRMARINEIEKELENGNII